MFISHPDDVEAQVAAWQREYPGLLEVEAIFQYGGRPVYALTVTDKRVPPEQKRKMMVFKPHAHEPAPIAAQMNIISQLLTGNSLDGTPTSLDRERILGQTLLTFMPDANPDGTARAPVRAWDGSQYTNEEFWAWMRGPDPITGKMWKRVDLWDDTVESPLPARYGIVYERVSEHEYVEPNRHHRSTLFQWIFRLRERYRWDQMLDLHQTEFVGSNYNAMIILPCIIDELPSEIQSFSRAWAAEIITAWDTTPGARPMPQAEPLGYTGVERQYFVDRWGAIEADTPLITSEIQNNNLQTPPDLQQRLNEVAIEASIGRLLQ